VPDNQKLQLKEVVSFQHLLINLVENLTIGIK